MAPMHFMWMVLYCGSSLRIVRCAVAPFRTFTPPPSRTNTRRSSYGYGIVALGSWPHLGDSLGLTGRCCKNREGRRASV
jgi:hypothetical protein